MIELREHPLGALNLLRKLCQPDFCFYIKMVQLRRSHNLPSTTCILLSLFNLSSLSLGKAVRNGGLAQKASYGDDLGSLSLKELDYIPRFGEMGQMSMRDSVFHGNRSPMLAVRQEGSIEADCNPGEHSCKFHTSYRIIRAVNSNILLKHRSRTWAKRLLQE